MQWMSLSGVSKMPIEGADYFVRLVDFPVCSCGGVVMPNDDGTFTVLINARLSRQQNRESLEHERNHILHDDFWRDAPLHEKELEAG